MSEVKRVPLSERIRPDSEAAPWVCDEVRRMESDYDALAAKFDDPDYPPKHARRLIDQLRTERDAALAELAALKGGQEERREWPDDDIVAAWKWCEENGGTPAEFLSYSLLGKRSRVLGRPLTWREAIELTHATTDMPDAQRDKLLAMDDAPPAQASAWVPEGWRLVPVDPTQDMRQDGDYAYQRKIDDQHSPTPTELYDGGPVEACWRAMLAASPTPGASDGKGGE